MENFSSQLSHWLPFFTTLTVACATLAGLLFVALSLHAGVLRSEENANLRHLATHTFGDFVTIMFIGLFFIAPWPTSSFAAIGTLITTIVAFVHSTQRFLELYRDHNNHPHRKYFFARLRLTLLAQLFLFIGAIGLFLSPIIVNGANGYMLLIFAGSVILLVAAMKNTWYLLAHELRK